MEVKDKILEILIFTVFGNNPTFLFSVEYDDYNNSNCYIGIDSVREYNRSIWGVSMGKQIKNGRLQYDDRYESFCKEWVDSFLNDIKLQLFCPNSQTEYLNVCDYLRKLKIKTMTATDLNNDFEKKEHELWKLYNISFCVQGEIGKEKIGISEINRDSSLFLLENSDWIETWTYDWETKQHGNDYFKDFLHKLKEQKDIVTLSKLFCDHIGETRVNRKITKLDNDEYEVTFFSWDLWKNKEIEWLEQIGEIKKEHGYFSSFTNLVITGTYKEIETMLELVKGEK